MAVRLCPKVLIQTATTFGDWTYRPDIRCQTATEGLGQILGSGRLTRNLGRNRYPGQATSTVANVLPLDLDGHYVRILVEVVSGTVPPTSWEVDAPDVPDGLAGNYAPLWHGIIRGSQLVDEGGTVGVQTYDAVGLGFLLTQRAVGVAHAVRRPSGASAYAVEVTDSQPMNARQIGGKGRSASKYQVPQPGNTGSPLPGAPSVYVLDPKQGTAPWTAANALEWLVGSRLSGFAGLTFAVSDPDACLTFRAPELDLPRLGVDEALTAISTPRRGLSWRLIVTSPKTGPGTVAIEARPTNAAPITVGSETLPANSKTWAPDLTGNDLENVVWDSDASAVVDEIHVLGDRPWYGISLRYEPGQSLVALQKGWATSQETAWNSYSKSPDGEPVWRAFELSETWAGFQDSDDGDRQGTAGPGAHTPPYLCEITRDLPCSDGWGTLAIGPRQAPVVVGKTGSTWTTLAGASAAGRMSVHVEEHAVFLGSGDTDQTLVKSFTGGIVASVGLRTPFRIESRWVRNEGPLRDTPRTMVVDASDCQLWTVLAGTAKGTTSAGAIDRTSVDSVVRDDRPRLEAICAQLVAAYSTPRFTIAWTQRGFIDFDEIRAPGTLIPYATTGLGVLSCGNGAIISSRTWTFDDATFGTTYATTSPTFVLESQA